MGQLPRRNEPNAALDPNPIRGGGKSEMRSKANFLVVVAAVLTLVCVLPALEVQAQGITVAPGEPAITVGQTQRFTATGLDLAVAVEGGAFHLCARLQDGTVRCWGLND
ncbi:MAG: hypothetical protein E6G66_12715, partial [Actinobacteria bacterium]